MKIALGHLGNLTQSIKSSLEELGFEVVIPKNSSKQLLEVGKSYLSSNVCFPLKAAIGNYIAVMEDSPDVILYYSGCDLCNLPPANCFFTEVLNDLGWNPETYCINIDSKRSFIKSYFSTVKRLSNKPVYKILTSLYLIAVKYEAFHFFEELFYCLAPQLQNKNLYNELYSFYYTKISLSSQVEQINKLVNEMIGLYRQYLSSSSSNYLKLGLVGDSYSLLEPSVHNNIDKYLGNLNVVVDKWSYNYISLSGSTYKTDVYQKLYKMTRKNTGAYTPTEIHKITKCINNGYDGIVFIAPFNCNPNDVLRSLLTRVRDELEFPVFELLLDEHTSDTGIHTRLEAFVDMVKRKHNQKIQSQVHTPRFRRFSLARFLVDPMY